MITDAERANSYETAIQVAIGSDRAGLWTALPGIIQSFDPATQTAEIQPSIQCGVTAPDGSKSLVNIPLLLDCPVHFPRGGGAVMTFPVAPGDECLVVFASRCIDSWFQQGGVQPQFEFRMHDLSDGFAFIGFSSLPHVVTAISTAAVELRSLTGTTKISLDPTAQTVAIVAPGGATITANTTINGTLHVTGNITSDTDVLAGSISLKTHTHGGVTAGGAQTGAPT